MPTRCLETRLTPEGWRRRRYADDNGHRWNTIEVPLELWQQMNSQGRGRDRSAAVMRNRERKSVKARALFLLRSGWRTIAVASEVNKPVRTVQRWAADAGVKTTAR